MKISTRLAAGFGLLIVLLILCTGTALWALHLAREGMNDTVNIKMKKYQLAQSMFGEIRDIGIAVRNITLFSDPALMKPEVERINKQKALFIANRQALGDIMKTDSTAAGREAYGRITEAEGPTFSVLDKSVQLGLGNLDQQATDYLIKEVRPVQTKLLAALKDMTEIQQHNSQAAVQLNSSSTGSASLILMLLTGASVLVAAGACVVVTRVLMRQLGGEPAQAQALAATIAAGDLTSDVQLRCNDTTSLLASLGTMQTNLRGLVSQIKDTSASVALAADEIARGNTEL